MGWGNGTVIFDVVAKAALSKDPIDKKQLLMDVTIALEDLDWDTHSESRYKNRKLVKEVFNELHPDWEL
jgi:hypothetical protein